MEKNPVSFLQEYAMGVLKVLPVYRIISETSGTHINSFNIRVSFNGLNAEGVGFSKKEAKLKAAMNMIDMLKIKEGQSFSSSPLLNESCSSVDSAISNTRINKNSSINYVGKLQEFTANNINGSLPEYELIEVRGPAHNPEFTVICKYEKKSEMAKGHSKKEAKKLAAQKMYEALTRNTKEIAETKLQTYLETMSEGLKQIEIFDSNEKSMENSKQKAGPAHSPEFTVICKDEKKPEMAKGYSKTEAKTLAAPEKYEALTRNTKEIPETKLQNYLETMSEGLKQLEIFDSNEKAMEKSRQKFMINYSKLRATKVEKTCSNYYKILKDSITATNRVLVMDKLHDIMEACERCLSLGDSTTPMALLKTALSSINIKMKKMECKRMSKNYICSVMLETQPVINEIACGKTCKEAEVTAIFLIAKTLVILLL